MESEQFDRIFRDKQELLSLPQTLVEVLKLARDENSHADDLGKVIMRDPALTARILRIVNSAFYGASREISTITQAVVMLGMRQVTALALSSSVYNLTSQWDTSIDLTRFWRHSLEVAIASRLIAKKIGQPHPDELFVAGLLHDVGLLIMERSFKADFARVWKKAQAAEEFGDLEEETWGTNHAKVGRFLFEQWRLPESICNAVGMHHTTFVPGADDPELQVPQVVSLANMLSRFSIGESGEWQMSIRSESRRIIRENLKLSEEDLLSIEKELFSRTIEEARFLEMEIGSSNEILEEANRILFEQYVTVETLLRENQRMQEQAIVDKYGRLSLNSLRTTSSLFARHVETAAGSVSTHLSVIKSGIDQGTISDVSGGARNSVNAIQESLGAVYNLASQMKNYSALNIGDLADEERRLEVEKNMRLQLETSCEPV